MLRAVESNPSSPQASELLLIGLAVVALLVVIAILVWVVRRGRDH